MRFRKSHEVTTCTYPYCLFLTMIKEELKYGAKKRESIQSNFSALVNQIQIFNYSPPLYHTLKN